jgi:hypothetical protein
MFKNDAGVFDTAVAGVSAALRIFVNWRACDGRAPCVVAIRVAGIARQLSSGDDDAGSF